MSKVLTSFSPVSQGFQFPNYFTVKLPVKFQLPLAGTVDLNNVVFGLCGGMCFAALDYFYTRHILPRYVSPQELDSRLLVFLCERQIDSLQVPVLLKVIDWMASGNDSIAARMIKSEIPKLRRTLDRGEPAVLCLIRTHGLENPTQNHQVVATGYDLDAGMMTISLYDPNHPGQTPTIRVCLNRRDFSIQQSSGEALRGFFLIPYKTQKAVPLSAEETPFDALSFDLSAAPEPPFRLKWPVDSRRINQRFGENPAMYRPFKLAGHEGVDFFAPSGAQVYAAFDGTVYEAKYRGAYGNQVRIRHEHNGTKFQTVYAHLERTLAAAGQEVKAGELIGIADNTGNSHGAHLHLTLFIDGAKTPGYYDGIVDPWPYLEGNEPPALPTLSGVFVYTMNEAHLRALPSTVNTAVLTTLPAGERLPVFGEAAAARNRIGKKDQWLQVQTSSGQVGYVAAWLVSDAAQQVLPPSDLVVYAFDNQVIHTGPGLGLGSVGKISPTSPLIVLGNTETGQSKVGQAGQWLQVQAQDGTHGFVPAWMVHVTGQAPPTTNLVISPTGNVNLRAQPNTNPGTDILAVVTPEDALTVLGDKAQAQAKIGVEGQWINVRAPNGVMGWTAAWFVSVRNNSVKAPQQVTASALLVYPTPEIGINIRATADASAMRISGALCGEPLTVIEADLNAARAKVGVQDQWLYVQKENGNRGWAAAWFVGLHPK